MSDTAISQSPSALLLSKIPALLQELDNSRANSSWSFDEFSNPSVQTVRALSEGGIDGFSGCYLFFNGDENIYVGISRNLPKRLWNHFNARSVSTSSFVDKVARFYPETSEIEQQRSTALTEFRQNSQYQTDFNEALTLVRGWRVAHVRIHDPTLLYVFEACAALHYKTQMNCFRTH